jgi:hypothetical protein
MLVNIAHYQDLRLFPAMTIGKVTQADGSESKGGYY